MSEFKRAFGQSGLEQPTPIGKKDTNLDTFEKTNTGKNTEELTLLLNGLQGEFEEAIKKAPDTDINNFDLESDTFAIEAEGLHKEAIVEAKIKIIKKLLEAEEKYTVH